MLAGKLEHFQIIFLFSVFGVLFSCLLAALDCQIPYFEYSSVLHEKNVIFHLQAFSCKVSLSYADHILGCFERHKNFEESSRALGELCASRQGIVG